MHAPRKPSFTDRFEKSPFFFGAILLHIVIGLMVGSAVVIRNFNDNHEFKPSGPIVDNGASPVIAPPIHATDNAIDVNVDDNIHIDAATGEDKPAEVTVNPGAPAFAMDHHLSSILSGSSDTIGKTTESIKKINSGIQEKLNQERTEKIRQLMIEFSPLGESNGPLGYGPALQAVFNCYVMSAGPIRGEDLILEKVNRHFKTHSSAAVERKEMIVERGPIKNLMMMINGWSQGKINANVMGNVMTLTDDSIFKNKTPFLYFCGYQDFVLSQKEIENLRAYLIMGGCVWGDNGLSGVGSAFDIAFKREMKRVLNSADKDWEIVPEDHPIFKGSKAFFQIDGGAPCGMNFRKDPIEMIRLDGEIAVLYTPNNYTDLMRMSFKPPIREAKNELLSEPIDSPFHKDQRFYDLKYISSTTPFRYTSYGVSELFRNFKPEASEESFKLGINIVVHLLTRFQDRLTFGK